MATEINAELLQLLLSPVRSGNTVLTTAEGTIVGMATGGGPAGSVVLADAVVSAGAGPAGAGPAGAGAAGAAAGGGPAGAAVAAS